MRASDVKPGFVAMTAEQYEQFAKIIDTKNSPVPEAQTIEQLDAAFAAGAPINGVGGKFGVANTRTIIDWASDAQNEAVLLYMLNKAPELTYTPDGLLGYCLWSARAVDKLFSLGKTIDAARKAWSRFDEKVVCQAHPDAIQMLVDHGYDLDGTVTILKQAAKPFLLHLSHRTERLIAALQAGANPLVRGKGGRSFLHGAVDGDERSSKPGLDTNEVAGMKTLILSKFEQILQTCVDRGIDVNMADDDGATPLHLAARRGYPNKARALLLAGADPTLTDSMGRTPAMLAKAGRHSEVQAVLAALRAQEAIQNVLGAASKRAVERTTP